MLNSKRHGSLWGLATGFRRLAIRAGHIGSRRYSENEFHKSNEDLEYVAIKCSLLIKMTIRNLF